MADKKEQKLRELYTVHVRSFIYFIQIAMRIRTRRKKKRRKKK